MLSGNNRSIYNFAPSLESESNNDWEIVMVGQSDVHGDQTEQEIVEAVTAEISTSNKPAKDAEKAVGKRHM
jgi:hypothetical protein